MATSVRKANGLANGTLADETLVIIGDPTNGDYIKTTIALLKAYLGAGTNRQAIANSTSIPFTHGVTAIAPHIMSGPRSITPNTTGALAGYGAFQEIIGDGTNTPTFPGFRKSNASKDFVATAGVVNLVMFVYTGSNKYWYTIFQEAGVGTPTPITPAAPTAGVVDDTADTFNWTNNPSYTSVSQLEQTLDGGTTVTAVSAKPISVGNATKAAGQIGIRVKAIGIDNPSAWLFNASAFTAAGGADVTAPELLSAVIQAGSPSIILLTYNEALNGTNPAQGKFAPLVDGVADPVTTTLNSGATSSLALTTPVVAGQAVVLAYAPGSSGNRIADVAGNFAAGFSNQAVTNNLVGSGSTLLNGLVSYWKLNEATGNRADSVGGFTLTDVNGVLSTTGVQGNAALFERDNSQRLTSAAGGRLDGLTAFTINFWFKITNNTVPQGLFGRFAVGDGYSYLNYFDGAALQFLLRNSADQEVTAQYDIPTSDWNMYTITWDGTTVKTFVNAALSGNQTLGGTINYDADNIFCIGDIVGASGRYLDCPICQVGIWNRELIGAEKTALYNSGAGATHPF